MQADTLPYPTGLADARAYGAALGFLAGKAHAAAQAFMDAHTTALQVLAGAQPTRPKIVCLCGSTRFYDAFQQANYDETMAGRIVLSVGFYPHSKAAHGHGEGVGHDSAEKLALDELHKRKIDLADEVLVLNVGGYIGDSTRSEIDYAISHGKPVRWLEPPERQNAKPCPCDQFCPDGERCDGLTTQEAVARLNAEAKSAKTSPAGPAVCGVTDPYSGIVCAKPADHAEKWNDEVHDHVHPFKPMTASSVGSCAVCSRPRSHSNHDGTEPPADPELCNAVSPFGGGPCIKPDGHLQAGDPVHDDGDATGGETGAEANR